MSYFRNWHLPKMWAGTKRKPLSSLWQPIAQRENSRETPISVRFSDDFGKQIQFFLSAEEANQLLRTLQSSMKGEGKFKRPSLVDEDRPE